VSVLAKGLSLPLLAKVLNPPLHVADLRLLPRELSPQALHALFHAGEASKGIFCARVTVWARAVERHLVERALVAAQVPFHAAVVRHGTRLCCV